MWGVICLAYHWDKYGKVKFESQHRTGSNVIHSLSEVQMCIRVCSVRFHRPSCTLLPDFWKAVSVVLVQTGHYYPGTNMQLTAKLPFGYSLGLNPKDTALLLQKWSLGNCFKCWRLPPLTYFLLYQRHSWLDRKACWLAPSHPVCFCTSLLCGAGSRSYSFFMTFPHYTLLNCSLFLWPWSPIEQSKRSGTVFKLPSEKAGNTKLFSKSLWLSIYFFVWELKNPFFYSCLLIN